MKFFTATILGLLLNDFQGAFAAPAESTAVLSTDATPASVEAIVDSDASVFVASAKTDQFSRCQAAVCC